MTQVLSSSQMLDMLYFIFCTPLSSLPS